LEKKTGTTGVFSGIKNSLNLPPDPAATDVFTGGAEIDVDGVRFHFFGNGTHNWSTSTGGSFNALITAGGGGGGNNDNGHAGGGGGAGQVNKGTLTLTAGQTGSMTIGTGGAFGNGGANGGDSTFTTGGTTYTMKGGGGGGSTTSGGNSPGSNGGSGGGGGGRNSASGGSSNKTSDFLGLTSYGLGGGQAQPNNNSGQNAGGGGGAGWVAGKNGINRQKGGRGGMPIPPISIGASQLTVASGGAGGAAEYQRYGSGGTAYVNGGHGGYGHSGFPAVPDTGSGGGGAGDNGSGGFGADGCAVIWYPSPGGSSNSYSKLDLQLDFDPADYNLANNTEITSSHNRLDRTGNWTISNYGGPTFFTNNGGFLTTGNNAAIRCTPYNNGQYTLNAATEMTISGWFRISSDSRQVLVSRWNTQFNHLCDPNGGFHWNNNMVGCGNGDVQNAECWDLNRWHYITWAYSGATKVHCWWVDGHPVTTVAVGDGSIATSSSTETGNITIGTRTDGGEWLNGRIGPVRIYSRAITTGEIIADFENTRGRFSV
jgi:hypothetical protein